MATKVEYTAAPSVPKKKKGDTAHLSEWRDFLKTFRSVHEDSCKGKSAAWVAKQAGFAYRKKKGKSKPTDPEKLEYDI
jgi:hypothetical protein